MIGNTLVAVAAVIINSALFAATIEIEVSSADYQLLEGVGGNPPIPDFSAASVSSTGRAGSSTSSGANFSNGRNLVYVFPLPALASGDSLSSANLRFTYTGKSGSPSPSQNADLVALDINQATTPILRYSESDTPETGSLKIQDNIITSTTAAGEVTLTAAGKTNLLAYLDSFYKANPDYPGGSNVFLRLNPDFDTNDIRGYNAVMQENSGPDPVLILSAPSITDLAVESIQSDATEAPLRAGYIRFRRLGSTSAARSVNYTVSGTAASGTDFIALPGSVTIPTGASSIDVAVRPIPDGLAEPMESVIIQSDQASQGATVNIADRAFAHFSALYPGAGALTDDEDGDGRSLLLEYGDGTNPRVPDASSSSAELKEGVFSWLRRENRAASDLTFTLETSPDLAASSWVNQSSARRMLGYDSATGDPLIEHRVDATGEPRRFYRMNIAQNPNPAQRSYLSYVQECMDTLIQFGSDRYGAVNAPVLVSILDVRTRDCPEVPEALDEAWRTQRRGRRSPGGSNFFFDQATLDTMLLISGATGDEKYSDFAKAYMSWAMQNLTDTRSGHEGTFWWGWHYFYDVFTDTKKAFVNSETPGSQSAYHEIHESQSIDWEKMWDLNPVAVQTEIEMIWNWHVVDKATGRVNRHDVITPSTIGFDFSMSAASYVKAFAFLHSKGVGGGVWLTRAKLLTNYYWNARNTTTNLFPEAPYAEGTNRFDKVRFTTAAAGLHTHGLLEAFELTGDPIFRDRALAYLKAYALYGYDSATGKFWGSLQLNGTAVQGPRVTDPTDYAASEPRGHLDCCQPYVAGYEYPIYAAMAFAYGYQITGSAELLTAARRFATFIDANMPPEQSLVNSTYATYSTEYAPHGTYAATYAHIVSFFVNMYVLTGEQAFLDKAKARADDAISKLYFNGLFRGHPAKPYYENIDGVGFLLYALVQLHAVQENPARAVSEKSILLGSEVQVKLNNW